jgi:hypothetical protein
MRFSYEIPSTLSLNFEPLNKQALVYTNQVGFDDTQVKWGYLTGRKLQELEEWQIGEAVEG